MRTAASREKLGPAQAVAPQPALHQRGLADPAGGDQHDDPGAGPRARAGPGGVKHLKQQRSTR